ncbi:LamG-like jellyroll fold domain-containing protein [Hwangdonia sp.]|uniref:LamG-like jellyroll fold domain-containing protein n=1 Tax=Hwangdonia sp. TaxID=1883432 RepID=UPI003AB5EFBE
MKTKLLVALGLLFAVTLSFAQNSGVKIKVKWPSNSYENKIEVYNTTNDLLLTICDDSQCYSATQTGPLQAYGGRYDLGCVTNGNNYYIKLYDIADNGWSGGSFVSVEVAGIEILNNNGSSASASGDTLYFNVSGGDAVCNALTDTDGDGIADYLDYDDDADGITDAIENLGKNRFECTLPALDFINGTYDASASSGSAGTVGSIYRFGNAIQGYDVLMEITELNNTTIANIDNDLVDNPTYLQTELTFSGVGTPGATFKFTIVDAGTTSPSTQIFRVNGITWDCDGSGSLKESVVYQNPAAYGVENPSNLEILDLGSNNIQISASGLQEGPGFSNLKVLRAYYQFIGNSFTMRMQALKTSTGTSTRQFGMSFTQCEFLDFNANSLIIVTGEDDDGDGRYNHLDIDSDADGIPDNVEAQPTIGYLVPTGTISTNGIDINYGTGLLVVDTDGDKIPDFLDTDSDNDGYLDIQENGMADTSTAADVDNDGLNNAFETNGVMDVVWDVNEDIEDPTDLSILPDTDSDLTLGGDLDYRDLFDISLPIYASIDFDGVDDYLSRTGFIDGLNDVTVMAWVKTDSGNSTDMVVAGEDTGFKLWLQNGKKPMLTVKTSGNAESILGCSCANINYDEWHHLTGTYTSATGVMALYVDGTLVSSKNVGSSGAAIEVTGNSNGNFEVGRLSSESFNKEYFKGDIDEVRVFNTALNSEQIQQMVYQEIVNNAGYVTGSMVPKHIGDISGCTTIPWNNLLAYYPMTNIQMGTTSDYSSYNNLLYINYITTVQEQTAPMPYTTSNDGDWSTEGTWLHGNVWDIENETTNKDWSIVSIKNNVNTSNNHNTLGLLIDSGATLAINNDKLLNNSWYLKIDGKLDLQGESQLIQSEDSSLEVTSSGTLERDQQGTKDFYTYNYWSSPVGVSNTTSNNNSYTLADVLNDGSVATTPLPITFVSGHNGTPGSPGITPVGIASTWIWKYANKLTDDYASWQHVKNTGTILAGEGYTMKGVDNSATSFTEEQNYVFNGKPHNGDITLTLSAGNDYLIGNPYASAIDADEFILDNISAGAGRATSNIIDGTLYFWDHFAGNTHVLREYQGGYATYTLMGGIKAVSTDTRINASGQVGTKVPQQYIPVSQGFFVTADTGGTITFKNSQRIFKTEASDPSLFLKGTKSKGKSSTAETDLDDRQKIRLMLDSPKGYHRQLLVGVDENATSGIDKGYDAPLIEDNVEDLFWIFSNKNFVIQAVDNFDRTQVLPLGIKINQEGLATIKIDALENIPNSTKIYLHDKELDVYQDLKKKDYDVHLAVGEYLNRFEIRFSKSSQTLSTNETNKKSIEVYFSNEEDQVIVHNPSAQLIESVEMINILGQSLFKFKISSNDDYLKYKASQIKAGTYVLKIETEYGKLSKKVLIK